MLGLRHASDPDHLAAVSTLATGWLLAQLWSGSADGWVGADSQAPWGPLVDLLPLYGVLGREVGEVWP